MEQKTFFWAKKQVMLWEKPCEVYIRIGLMRVIENAALGTCAETVNLSAMFKLYSAINLL